MQSVHAGNAQHCGACVQTVHKCSRTASRPRKDAEVARPLSLRASVCQKSVATWAFGHHRPSGTSRRRRQTTKCSATTTFIGLGVFFTPSIVAVIYAYFKGKGNVKDGLSRLLTEVTQGYFQPNVGGESIPVAQGELSDLAGDEPLFKALYQW